jgi:hypothetical protein
MISLVLAAPVGALSVLAAPGGPPTPLRAILTYLAAVNLLVAVFNMVPAFSWFIMQAEGAGLAQASLRQALGGLRVRDIMTTEVRTVPADATVHDMIEEYFIRHTYGGYPVEKNGHVVGLVSLRELRNTPVEDRATTRVERSWFPSRPVSWWTPARR